MAIVKIGKLEDYMNPLKMYMVKKGKELFNKTVNKTASGLTDKSAQNRNLVEQKLAEVTEKLQAENAATLSATAKASTKATYSEDVNGNYTYNATATRQGTDNNYTTLLNYIGLGQRMSTSRATLDSLTTVVNNNTGTSQTTALAQEKDITASLADKKVGSQLQQVMIDVSSQAGAVHKTTSIDTTAGQTADKVSQSIARTETEKTVTNLDAQNNVASEAYTHSIVLNSTSSIWNQQYNATGSRDIIQDAVTSVVQGNGTKEITTNYDTQDVRSNSANYVTNSTTDSLISTMNLTQGGGLASASYIDRQTNYTEAKGIDTQETINTDRQVNQVISATEKVTTDVSKETDAFSQNTAAVAETHTNTFDRMTGNLLSSQTTVTNTNTVQERESTTDINRQIVQTQGGIQGSGSLNQQIETSIVTDINTQQTTNNVMKTTDRTIERDISQEKQVEWNAGIQIANTGDGGKTYGISSVEVGKTQVVDVTNEGVKQLTVATTTDSSKEVTGSVAYSPDAISPVQSSLPVSIGVNFSTYTGLASGFKLDSGEVSFKLSLASSEATVQDKTQSVEGAIVAQNSTSTGQLNDATLTGTLTSRIGEDGSRIISLSAFYDRTGQKYVDGAEMATGEQDTQIEIAGSIALSKTGDTKSMSSSFDLYKVEETQAEGTGVNAVRSALDQADPLRKGFSLDNGIFRFNLGFATLNFSIYA